MTEDFIDYEEESTFEVPEDLFEDVSTGRNARDDYEASDEFITDSQTEAFREEYAPVAAKETAKIAHDDDSGIYGGMKNFFKHGVIGVAKGVEEAGQTVGSTFICTYYCCYRCCRCGCCSCGSYWSC